MDQTNQNETEKKLDRWLDAALAHYSHGDEAEPRIGLEARVLATLEADRREREQHRWPWRLVLAAGLAMVLIVIIARAPWGSIHQPIVKPAGETAKGATTGTQPQPPVIATVKSNRTHGIVAARRSTERPALVSKAASPRLAQFPAPRPLSKQEQLLVTLVNNASPEQLVEDAALQQRLRSEVEGTGISGGGALEPRGK